LSKNQVVMVSAFVVFLYLHMFGWLIPIITNFVFGIGFCLLLPDWLNRNKK